MEDDVHNTPTLPDHPAFVAPPKVHKAGRFFLGLLAVLVILAGAYTVYVWGHKKVTDLKGSTAQLEAQAVNLQKQLDITNKKAAPQPGVVHLFNNTISLTLPRGWGEATALELNAPCISLMPERTTCEDIATVYPGAPGETAPKFSFDIQVLQNVAKTDAKTWFISVYGGGDANAAEGDQTSTAKINGYDAYYYLQNVPNTYKDVTYVVTAAGHAVLMTARVYEKNAAGTHDFTQYQPAIQTIMSSIKFEGN